MPVISTRLTQGLYYETESASVSENDDKSENAFKINEIESFAYVDQSILLSNTFSAVCKLNDFEFCLILSNANVQQT